MLYSAGHMAQRGQNACETGRTEVKAEIQRLEVVSALERFKDPDLMRGERITAAVQLPGSLEGYQKLSIYAEMPEKTFAGFRFQ